MSAETSCVISIVILAAAVCVILAITMYLIPIILGLFPYLKARKLSEKDIAVLKEQGICHKTTDKGLKRIQEEKTIKGSKGGKSIFYTS